MLALYVLKRARGMKNDPDFLDAVEFGDFEGVKRYSNNGVYMNINAQDYIGKIPAMIAAYYGHTEILEWMACRHRINTKLKDDSGKTVIDYAIESVNTECIKLLEKYI